jgi:hypothetical protein
MLDARTNLALSSAGRILVGLAMLIAPKRIGEGWLGRGGRAEESAALMRVAGVRDAAFGVGGLVAARSGGDPRPWLAASVVIDGTDAVATFRAEGVPAANGSQRWLSQWARRSGASSPFFRTTVERRLQRAASRSASRSSMRRILPVRVFGSSSTNSTLRGYA